MNQNKKLALYKKRLGLKIQQIKEEEDAIIQHIQSITEEAYNQGQQLLDSASSQNFSKHYANIIGKLEDCQTQLLIIKTAVLQSDSGNEDDSDEYGGEADSGRVQAGNTSDTDSLFLPQQHSSPRRQQQILMNQQQNNVVVAQAIGPEPTGFSRLEQHSVSSHALHSLNSSFQPIDAASDVNAAVRNGSSVGSAVRGQPLVSDECNLANQQQPQFCVRSSQQQQNTNVSLLMGSYASLHSAADLHQSMARNSRLNDSQQSDTSTDFVEGAAAKLGLSDYESGSNTMLHHSHRQQPIHKSNMQVGGSDAKEQWAMSTPVANSNTSGTTSNALRQRPMSSALASSSMHAVNKDSLLQQPLKQHTMSSTLVNSSTKSVPHISAFHVPSSRDSASPRNTDNNSTHQPARKQLSKSSLPLTASDNSFKTYEYTYSKGNSAEPEVKIIKHPTSTVESDSEQLAPNSITNNLQNKNPGTTTAKPFPGAGLSRPKAASPPMPASLKDVDNEEETPRLTYVPGAKRIHRAEAERARKQMERNMFLKYHQKDEETAKALMDRMYTVKNPEYESMYKAPPKMPSNPPPDDSDEEDVDAERTATSRNSNTKHDEDDLSLPKLELIGAPAHVPVSFITQEHPSYFWLQHKNNKLEKMLDDLQYYNLQISNYDPGSTLSSEPYVGQLVCACNHDNDTWHRAKVITIDNARMGSADSIVSVLYVDFGQVDHDVPVTELRPLPNQFRKLAPQAIPCALNQTYPADGNHWTQAQLEEFESIVTAKSTSIEAELFTNKLHPISFVNLFCKKRKSIHSPGRDTELVKVNDYLIKRDMARRQDNREVARLLYTYTNTIDGSQRSKNNLGTTPLIREQAPVVLDMLLDDTTTDEDGTNNTVSTLLTSSPPVKSGGTVPFNPYAHQMVNTYSLPSDSLGSFVEDDKFVFMVAHIDTPERFFVHPTSKHHPSFLQEITLALHQFCKNNSAHEMEPVVGIHCAAYDENEQCLYRARVLDMMEKDRTDYVQVYYVDFGNTEWIYKELIYHMPEELYKYPPQAYQCCLADVVPAVALAMMDDNDSDWSKQACKEFTNLTGYKKTFYGSISATRRDCSDKLGNTVYAVKIYDTTKKLDVCVNGELIRRGVAFPARLADDVCKTPTPSKPTPPPVYLLATRDNESPQQLKTTAAIVASQQQLIQAAHPKDKHNYDEIADLDDAMLADYNSHRNTYSVNVDDVGEATVGWGSNTQHDRQMCKYVMYGKACPDGENCQFVHKQLEDGVPTCAVVDTVCVHDAEHNLDLPAVDSWILVQVTCIVNPNHMYVVMPLGSEHIIDASRSTGGLDKHEDYDEHGSTLQSLVVQMTQHYEEISHHQNSYTTLPGEGDIIVARSTDDLCWYRARVLCVEEDQRRILVFYVDFGDTALVSFNNTREMDLQFMHLAFQAVECFLDIKPAEGKQWSKDAKSLMTKNAQNKLLLAYICRVDNECIHARLYNIKKSVKSSIDEQLILHGCALRY